MSFKLLSHPDVLLRDHLDQVLSSGLTTFDRNAVFSKFRTVLRVILAFHDLGKGSSCFQDYLSQKAPRSKLTRHSEISALWACYHLITQYQTNTLDALIAYVCIASHHGPLGNFTDSLGPDLLPEELLKISEHMDYYELNNIFEHLGLPTNLSHAGFQDVIKYFEKSPPSMLFRKQRKNIQENTWIVLDYLFSLLIWSDKYSAIFHQNANYTVKQVWETDLLDRFKTHFTNTDREIDQIREQAYNSLSLALRHEVGLYSINLPTGAGKTLSSLKVALELRKIRPELDHIIYCLPFTSVIDQNHQVFQSVLRNSDVSPDSSTLLAHHHLTDFVYTGRDENSKNESEYLVETWESELVVTTFVQLMATFLSTRNSSLKRFHRLSNAIILLDEIQNIPHYYWPLLKHSLKLISSQLNSVFILVTATLPLIFDPDDPELLELATQKDVWFKSLNRIELFHDLINTTICMDQLVEIICSDIRSEPDMKRLVILNTIKSSLELFEKLQQNIPNVDLIYLSSNVIPKQRLERINKIKKHSGKGLIIVSTQVVEAGVDIDVDVVYRDLAPLDSIIQASGRCNRNSVNTRSKVLVFQLAKDNKPYWKYIYDQTLVYGTIKVLSEFRNPIPESEFFFMSNEYYHHLHMVATQDRSRNIIGSLLRLDLDSALSYHPKHNPLAFNLIESFPTQTVFIESDPEASILASEFRELKGSTDAKDFEQRALIKSLFRKMGPYMINVDRRFIKTEDFIYFVDMDNLCLHYDMQTGFKREQTQEDYIF